MIQLPRLYAIADASFGDPVELSRALFDVGVAVVQIRNKKAGVRELLGQVEEVLKAAPTGARVIVNDRVDVALLTKASGVHVGQDDLPPDQARSLLGASTIIGFSTHTTAQALHADALPIDYIAAGPVFATSTKEKPERVIGLSGLSEICSSVRRPVVAIGGITLDRAHEVLRAGAHSIAVISDLLNTADIRARAQAWLHALEAWKTL